MAARRLLSSQHDLWIVLPVSGIARGKSRLAPLLAAVERGRLNRELVEHAVRAATGALSDPARCIVVSPCARSLRVAAAAGAMAIAEARPLRGLNAAIRQGVRHAMRCGARRVLILHSDLPRMSAAHLGAMLAQARRTRCRLVVPDRDRMGTNALLLPARLGMDLHFGPGSYAKHRRCAREAGEEPAICEVIALTHDLDTPEHYRAWIAAGRVWG